MAVTVYTLKRTKLTKTDVENFNAQYPTLEVKYTKVFHDRFLILDRGTAYHVGASLKDAGKNILESILSKMRESSGIYCSGWSWKPKNREFLTDKSAFYGSCSRLASTETYAFYSKNTNCMGLWKKQVMRPICLSSGLQEGGR